MIRISRLTVLLLFCASLASAQQVINPHIVQFAASADHATIVTRYDLYIYSLSGVLVQTYNLGKPTPDGSNQIVVDFSAIGPWPIADGVYYAKVAAVASIGTGVSDPSNQFTFYAAPPTCTYGVAPTSWSGAAAGGTSGVAISTSDPSCTWTVANVLDWVTVSPLSGVGSTTAITVTVAPNLGGVRSGGFTIAGFIYTVTQAALPPPPTCTGFTISPLSVSPNALAGLQSVGVTGTTPTGCTGGSWTAAGNGSWLMVTPTSGSGAGSVTVSWTANTLTSSRSSTVTVAGQTFTVTQAGISGGSPPQPARNVIIIK